MIKLTETNNRIVCKLPGGENNPRNSEGDFITLNDGRIMFAFSRYTGASGNDNAPCDIAALYSDNGGESFSIIPRILVTAAEYGETNIMSVSLMRMANGDIGLFFILKHSNGSSEYILRRSSDDGESFPGKGVSCLPLGYAGYYVINNNRVIRTESGRLWIPAAYHRALFGDYSESSIKYNSAALFYYSDDDGYTWNESPAKLGIINSGTGLQEPGIIELPGGALYAYFRTDMLCQYESVSLDGGSRWFMPQPSKFASPASPMKIARNPYTGIYYAVWNPIPNYPGRNTAGSGGRTPIVIADSGDGINFSNYEIIEGDPNMMYCYPAMYFPSPDTMLLYYGEQSLTCVVIRKITLK